ncbi:peptidoglycan-recognition protein LF-like [Macrosteles quadrilineatus]|uniref:peptidoglycan-recognition protein LF-like n=1 Tax=Macrosteles quadrilineatus TaxID=74068 RepID=UPI0023E12440|nr:peptidoglycan-recognition protein LF-like [Macrosteles quadrilineatus]
MPWDEGHAENDPPTWHRHPLNKYIRKRTGGPLPGYMKRWEWQAEGHQGLQRLNNLAPPYMGFPPASMANHVHFTHTATEECEGHETCAYLIKDLQDKHMKEQGEPDIRYSFMISKDDRIFEGRGWDGMCNIAEPFTTFYTASLEIALIGNYSKSKPPKPMIKTLKRLIEWGIVNKKLHCCYDKTYDYDLHNMYFGPSYPKNC